MRLFRRNRSDSPATTCSEINNKKAPLLESLSSSSQPVGDSAVAERVAVEHTNGENRRRLSAKADTDQQEEIRQQQASEIQRRECLSTATSEGAASSAFVEISAPCVSLEYNSAPAIDNVSANSTVPPSSLPTKRLSTSSNRDASADYQAMELEDVKHEVPSSHTGAWGAVMYWLSSNSFSPRNSSKKEALMKDEEPALSLSSKRLSAITALFCSPLVLYLFMFLSIATGLVYGAIKQYDLMSDIDWDEQLWVAFVGSSYLFVNDIPRLMEVISDGQVVQDSCLHAGGSLAALVMTGNGMYYRWRTSEALIPVNDDAYAKIYDYGACSVHMLIAGYDKYIEYGNKNKAYYNDGSNPCLVDQYYIQYVTNKYINYPPKWDYVVLADQSKRTASVEARNDTIDALISSYAPLLIKSGAVPLIVDTHAFWSSSANMSDLIDVPTFTELIYEGVLAYAEALQSVLPTAQAPVIVPIGLAYLTVWEENRTAWRTLFLSDQIHASYHGSYFFTVVLYTTLFGHLPQKQVAIPEHMEYLFGYSRKNLGGNSYPSDEEAQFLLNVAKRVVINGYIPRSFRAA